MRNGEALQQAQKRPVAETGPAVILLAEDDDAIRAVALAILTRQGHTVLAASDGRQALELAARYPGRIDMLLTDVLMPGMNGGELADRLRASRPGLRVLYTSGYSGDVLGGSAEPGALAFLPKPYNASMLAQKVREVLSE